MRIEDCEPSLRERIEQQITHDLACEAGTRRVQPSATLTLPDKTNAVEGTGDAPQPCQCDLCREHQALVRLERYDIQTAEQSPSSTDSPPPPEKLRESPWKPDPAGDKASPTQTS